MDFMTNNNKQKYAKFDCCFCDIISSTPQPYYYYSAAGCWMLDAGSAGYDMGYLNNNKGLHYNLRLKYQ
jgi:hypothetical protein